MTKIPYDRPNGGRNRLALDLDDLTQADAAALDGWRDDNHVAALQSFLNTCDLIDKPDWQPRYLAVAGGLNPGNVAEAVRVTGARAVDVSSGVEATRGVKSVELIRAFLGAVKAL